MSGAPNFKAERIRSPVHLAWIRTVPCSIPGCRGIRIEAAHLRCAEPGAMGLKPGDDKVTPLCAAHHAQQHAAGDEAAWWAGKRIDPVALAARLWSQSPANKIANGLGNGR